MLSEIEFLSPKKCFPINNRLFVGFCVLTVRTSVNSIETLVLNVKSFHKVLLIFLLELKVFDESLINLFNRSKRLLT